MSILIIIATGIIVGLLASLMKKRFPVWLYILIAFLGALSGAGISFGDSVLVIQYQFLNIWTVPVIFSVLFSTVTLFSDRRKMLQTVVSILIIIAVVVGLIYVDSSPSDYSGLFREEISRTGVERVGQPIEGFNAFIYLESFSGFEESDFDGVETIEGIYNLDGEELKYERTAGNPVTSAEETISEQGYKTLLANLSKRLAITINTEADIETLLEKLRESDVEPDSYIHDDFSISPPEGWYPYENGPGVFFVHDANLEIPKKTEGFARGPYFQVTVHTISIVEMFAQNLWTEGSEFLVSRDDVRIGTQEAIRVVTKAGGAGGEVLHYVFEATDSRVFILAHYPYERGSSDTDDFEQSVQSFMINYAIDDTTSDSSKNGTTDIRSSNVLVTNFEECIAAGNPAMESTKTKLLLRT